MKRMVVIALSLCGILLLGACRATDSVSPTTTNTVDPPTYTGVRITRWDNPPQAKLTVSAEDIQHIHEFLDTIEKTELPDAPPEGDGWQYGISFTVSEASPEVYTLYSDKMTMGNKTYRIDAGVLEQIGKLYEELNVPEKTAV